VGGSLSPDERAERTRRWRRRYGDEAATYDRSADRWERLLFGTGHREWVCGRAHGRTLEIAIGTGLNVPLYGPDVRLIGLDLTPEMLALADRRGKDLGRHVLLCEGDAQALPFPDGTFDTVVSTYSMCSVPDLPLAIHEMRRVLVPDGRLLLLDHVRSSVAPILWLQRLMELRPGREGDELTRRPLDEVVAAGFVIEGSDRFRAGIVERLFARKR
jgi:SAM-dependent methyltransferase